MLKEAVIPRHAVVAEDHVKVYLFVRNQNEAPPVECGAWMRIALLPAVAPTQYTSPQKVKIIE